MKRFIPALACALAACRSPEFPPYLDQEGDPCRSSQKFCADDETARVCVDGAWAIRSCDELCADVGPKMLSEGCVTTPIEDCVCTPEPGACVPGSTLCESDTQLSYCALANAEVIDTSTSQSMHDLRMFRNRLVHAPTENLPEQEVTSRAEELGELTLQLQDLLAPPALTWRDEIQATLQNLGGEGTLAQIYYEGISNTTTRELPKTWKSCVRYTLQLNSSDTKTYARHGSGTDIFKRVDKGLWAIREAS